MSKERKFCVDCKWHSTLEIKESEKDGSYASAKKQDPNKCSHPKALCVITKNIGSCYSERHHYSCGLEGENYEPKETK